MNDKIIKRVLYIDLKIKSPYNTYLYKGLPPGPIYMPDVSSIESVLNLQDHNYLFFVADVKRPGYHMFAKTNSQHNKNKRQYTLVIYDGIDHIKKRYMFKVLYVYENVITQKIALEKTYENEKLASNAEISSQKKKLN